MVSADLHAYHNFIGLASKGNSVELKNVTYSYDGKKDALSDITLKIGACETVAFVGCLLYTSVKFALFCELAVR